jgi:hypothetical protein
MHSNILRELFARYALEDAKSQEAYLQSLKPYAKRIWDGYRSQAVSVSYSEPKAQEAYLLRYFAPYSYLISTVLGDMAKQGVVLAGREGSLAVSLFGCGPGPELAGLIRHLKTMSKRPQMLHVRMLDVAADSWSHGRAIAYGGAISGEWEPSLIQIDSAHVDIASKVPFPDQDADLLVFQNCLNELSAAQQAIVEAKLKNMLLAAPKTTTTVLIERVGYSSTDDMLRRLRQWVNETAGYYAAGELDGEISFDCKGLLDRIPDPILQHLFVRKRDMSPVQPHEDGLILARYVKYRWLAIGKRS